MMKMFTATVLGMMVIGSVQAGPLNKADIASDARWIVHFDWEKYRTTELHQMITATPEHAKAAARIAVASAMLGFNPLEDIDSVTAYGTGYNQGNGAMIIRGLLDPRKATAMLEMNETHASQPYGARTIHTWKANRGGHDREGSCAFYDDGTVILGKAAATVKAAIDVLDMKAPSLKANRDGIVVPEVSPDVFMMVYADQFDGKGVQNPKAQFFKNAVSLTLAAAETDGIMVIEAEMGAEAADKAVLINNALTGMLSFAMLGAADDPAMAGMVNAFKINTDGQIVKLSFRQDAETFMEFVRQRMEKRHQRRPPRLEKQVPADQ